MADLTAIADDVERVIGLEPLFQRDVAPFGLGPESKPVEPNVFLRSGLVNVADDWPREAVSADAFPVPCRWPRPEQTPTD